MMMLPNPGVLDHLIRERQQKLRTTSARSQGTARSGLRVRIGHALIVAGLTLSGERAEIPARRPALPDPA